MGWLDYHLHAFDLQTSGRGRAMEIGIPDKESTHVQTIAGWTIGMSDHLIRPGISLPYKYDFGDGWVHDVLLEAMLLAEPRVKYPKCIGGERACPPEDCGGTPGYYRLMKILKNPRHREHTDMVAWLKGHAKNYWPYDPAHFDARAVRFSNPTKRWEQAFSQAAEK